MKRLVLLARWIAAAGVSASIVASMTGCGSSGRNIESPQQIATAGASMQKRGIVSQNDYTRLRALAAQSDSAHAISDADLEWSLHLLNTSRSALVHARVMTIAERLKNLTASQRATVRAAIVPFLHSPIQLDRLAAQRALRAL